MNGPGAPLGWWQTRTFVAALTLAATIPLLWPTIPPLVDLPGHMGRYRVQLSAGDYSWLRDWYDFRWSLIGNLGIDLLVVPLSRLVGLEPAVKLIVVVIPALTVGGLLWIAREVHGRVPPTALFALPLAYSFPFQFGFVNFALSMGIALCLFAWWLRLARQGRLGLRAAIFVPASCLLWVCHTFGWGFLGILAFSAEMIRQHDRRLRIGAGPLPHPTAQSGYSVGGRVGERAGTAIEQDGGGHWIEAWMRAGLGCAPLALPIVLMVFWRSGDHVTGQTADWFNWHAKIQWVAMILRDRWMAFDIAATAVFVLVVFKGLRDPGIGYSRHLGLSALFLLAVYLLLPRIVFGSAYADMRLAPFMVAVAVIAIRPKTALSTREAATLAALGLAFFLVRIGGTTISYAMFSRDYDTELAALDHVPVGAKLVSFVGQGCNNPWRMSRLEHLPALALERRAAYTNDQWSMPGAQLLTTRYRIAGRFAHDPSQVVTAFQCSREWWMPINRALLRFPRNAFDYVWLIRPPPYEARLVSDLVPVWRAGTSVLYRVDRLRPPPRYDAETMKPPRY